MRTVCGTGVGTRFSIRRNGWCGVLGERNVLRLGLKEIDEIVKLLEQDDNDHSMKFNENRLAVEEMVWVIEASKRTKRMTADMVD